MHYCSVCYIILYNVKDIYFRVTYASGNPAEGEVEKHNSKCLKNRFRNLSLMVYVYETVFHICPSVFVHTHTHLHIAYNMCARDNKWVRRGASVLTGVCVRARSMIDYNSNNNNNNRFTVVTCIYVIMYVFARRPNLNRRRPLGIGAAICAARQRLRRCVCFWLGLSVRSCVCVCVCTCMCGEGE